MFSCLLSFTRFAVGGAAVCALALTGCHAGEAPALHVAPGGKTNALGSAADPFPSIEAARDALRRLPAGQRKGTVIQVASGLYPVAETLSFTAADSGEPGAPVIYRSEEAANVILIGARTVMPADSQPVSDPAILSRLDPTARDHVRQVNLARLGLPPVPAFARSFQEEWRVMEVYCGKETLPQSRWPNGKENTTVERVLDSGDFSPGQDRGGVFVYRGDRPARWTNALASGGVWLRGFWRVPWVIEGIQVKSIDEAARTIAFATSIGRGIGSKYTPEVNGTRAGDGREAWHAINLIEEIDQPGEWAVDFSTQTLFVWPPADFSDARPLRVSTSTPPVISMDNASHVTLQGFTVTGRLGNGIEVRGGTSNTVAGCVVRNVGGVGMLVRSGEGHRLVSNDIFDTGGSGIDITGGDRRTLTPARHEVLNNHVYRVSRDFPLGAIIAGYQPFKPGSPGNERANIVGVRLAHNRVHDVSNSGFYYGGADNLLEFNEVYRVGQDSGDLGGFYTTGGWTTFGNVVRFNFVHHCPNANAFYMDDGDSGDLVTSNVVYRTDTGGFIGGGHFNRVRDNLFIDCHKAGFHVDARGVSRGYTPEDPRLSNDLHSVAFTLPPWNERHPQLQEIVRHDTTLPRGNEITGNVFIDCQLPVRLAGKPGELDGVLVEHNVTNAPASDLADLDRLQLVLRPGSDSARSAPGVAALPFDRIGLVADEYRPVVPRRVLEDPPSEKKPTPSFDSTVDVEASNRKSP